MNTQSMMKNTLLFLITSGLFFCSYAFAQPPTGGSILREGEQQGQREAIEKMRPTPPSEGVETSPELEASPDLRVYVKKIEFSGHDSLVSLEELRGVTAPYLEKECALSDLTRLAYDITEYLRERSGFLLSRAYLPEQDVTDGIVRIEIIPGTLDGDVEMALVKPARISKRLLENIARQAVSQDKAIRTREVERAVLLMNELPGISSRAYLDKGKSSGTTKVSIEAKESKWLSGMVYGDNFGNDSTGAFRRIAQVSLGDSLGWGDILQLTYINSNYLNQAAAQLSFPLGSQGLFVDIGGSGLSYKLKGKLKSLDGDGSAAAGNAGMRYPVILNRKTALWIGGGYDYYHLDDRFSGDSYSRRNISAGNTFVKGNMYDSILGGGLNYFLVLFNAGDVGISEGKDLDDAGAKTDGGYFRVSYLAARLQRVTENASLLFSVRGQASRGNLDSSQKIIIGGPTGVRAYPVGEAASDEGHVLTFETRHDLPLTPSWLNTQLVGFYDAGYAILHKDIWNNSVTNITGRNRYWIQGAGAGINIGKQGVYSLQLSYAFKLGDNPGRDTSGNDANNKNDNGQFWFQGKIWF